MAYRTEIWIPSKTLWLEVDVHFGHVGERMMTRVAYEKAMHRQYPKRELRFTQFDAPKTETYPIRIPELQALGRALARKA